MTDFDPLAEARAFVARTNGVKWPAVEELADVLTDVFTRGYQHGYEIGACDEFYSLLRGSNMTSCLICGAKLNNYEPAPIVYTTQPAGNTE